MASSSSRWEDKGWESSSAWQKGEEWEQRERREEGRWEGKTEEKEYSGYGASQKDKAKGTPLYSQMLVGDWQCPRCSNHVFAKNSSCPRCNSSKPPMITEEGKIMCQFYGTVTGCRNGIQCSFAHVDQKGGKGEKVVEKSRHRVPSPPPATTPARQEEQNSRDDEKGAKRANTGFGTPPTAHEEEFLADIKKTNNFPPIVKVPCRIQQDVINVLFRDKLKRVSEFAENTLKRAHSEIVEVTETKLKGASSQIANFLKAEMGQMQDKLYLPSGYTIGKMSPIQPEDIVEEQAPFQKGTPILAARNSTPIPKKAPFPLVQRSVRADTSRERTPKRASSGKGSERGVSADRSDKGSGSDKGRSSSKGKGQDLSKGVKDSGKGRHTELKKGVEIPPPEALQNQEPNLVYSKIPKKGCQQDSTSYKEVQ